MSNSWSRSRTRECIVFRDRWEGPNGNLDDESKESKVRAIHQMSNSGLGCQCLGL